MRSPKVPQKRNPNSTARRRNVCAIGILSILLAGVFVFAQPQKPADMENKRTETGGMENESSGIKDFDFLIGSWRVHHRRLKERLSENHEWIEFDGTCTMQKILGDAGN